MREWERVRERERERRRKVAERKNLKLRMHWRNNIYNYIYLLLSLLLLFVKHAMLIPDAETRIRKRRQCATRRYSRPIKAGARGANRKVMTAWTAMARIASRRKVYHQVARKNGTLQCLNRSVSRWGTWISRWGWDS